MSAAPAANPTSHECDASLLTSFVNGGLQTALDDHPHLSIHDILAWFNHPQTQTDLAKLKDLARAAAALRHSLARFSAIARLDDLCLNSQNESEARRAAIALLHPRSRHQRATPAAKSPGSATSESSDLKFPVPAAPPTNPAEPPSSLQSEISDLKFPVPAALPINPAELHSSLQSEISELTFPISSALPSDPSAGDAEHRSPHQPSAPTPPAPSPSPHPALSTASLSQRLHDLRAALAASPEDGPFDDALADQVISFWKDLGVPASHPDIIDALAEGRMNDLPEIAQRIRAGAPP